MGFKHQQNFKKLGRFLVNYIMSLAVFI